MVPPSVIISERISNNQQEQEKQQDEELTTDGINLNRSSQNDFSACQNRDNKVSHPSLSLGEEGSDSPLALGLESPVVVVVEEDSPPRMALLASSLAV